MKPLILFFSVFPIIGFAQKANSPKVNTIANEIGITASTQFMKNNFNFHTAGVQYKHWITENLGWRAMIGYGSYSSANDRSSFRYTPDTIYRRSVKDRISMPVIGLGLEAQRKFYKRVYMYAALDMQTGYGSGSTDTTIEKQYLVPGEKNSSYKTFDTPSANKDIKLFYMGFTPAVGAKLQFSKISVGIEISPIQVTYRGENRTTMSSSTGLADLSFGSLYQRFFLTYCF